MCRPLVLPTSCAWLYDVTVTMYEYRAVCVRVIDGDTVEMDIDLGFGVHLQGKAAHVRLAGIDAPELRTKDQKEKEKGRAAKAALEELALDQEVTLLTEKDRRSFSRYVGTLYVEEDGELVSINAKMVELGHAVESVG